MIKRNAGLVVTALIICAMIVINVKSTEPDEYFAPVTANNALEAEIGLKKGNVPPNFELTTLTGEVVKLSDYKGKKVILNFWATWCPPCKDEMPHLEKYYKKNKDSANVEIIAVNMTTQDRPEMVRKFVDAYGLTFPILFDNKGEVMDAYQILTLPMTYIINTDGTIGHQIRGPVEENLLKELVSNLE
ncbi:peroxiredoxin [Paenisporosarcina sp. TG20]|uniref:peroxiredoxin family protein n=1 Tax=Paenisporosarcina sp. TG20 TaxID=1211706 RepID=UPI0002E4982E|nr:TlpA disulfide reductase family protein [Paenisporosarcina sp. TG20]